MPLSVVALGFLGDYSARYDHFRDLASLAEMFVRSALEDRDYALHVVSGRAKTPESLRAKVIEKEYPDPSVQVTDLIGIRVITYYAEQVDKIAERLRSKVIVDEANSLDKRSALLEAERFGYRSVHVVGHLSRRATVDEQYMALRGVNLEIQIRSVLDHAWAEVEHELVYKSGSSHTPEFRRRFAAVAGSFEILEQEFLSLKTESRRLVDLHADQYRAKRDRSVVLDAARMIAALEVLRPGAVGWRMAEESGGSPVISPRIAVAALRSVHVASFGEMSVLFRRRTFVQSLEGFAALAGVAPAEVSHQSLVALIVGHKERAALDLYFPELVGYPLIGSALDG